LSRGTSYGAPTELEVEMAEEIIDAVPSVEMVRMVNSGTEATMSALRLARGAIARNKIVKFEGCYHGHGDSLLVKAGSGVATLGLPDSPGVTPDLTTLGKIIGGGLPVGAYGGRRDIMEQIAPAGPVYQAGTLSGNPLAMTAGLATLRRLRDRTVYERLEQAGRRLCDGLSEAAREAGVTTVANRVGSMFTTFFTDSPVTDWPSAARSERAAYGK